jgi:DNA polymerase III subunit epsilon
MTRQIVLDTETTGLSPEKGHRIIEIGCVEIINRRMTDNHYQVYINPEREIEHAAQEVHGISNEFLEDKPLFADIVEDFIQYVDGAELIIHNAPFDVGFINHEFKRLKSGIAKIDGACSIIDTLVMARERHPGQRNNLDALCKRYGVDNSKRDLHGALIDADLLARMYLAMTSGQDVLFSSSSDSEKTKKPSATTGDAAVSNDNNRKLKVVRADKTEVTMHNEMLNVLREQSKKDFWHNS